MTDTLTLDRLQTVMNKAGIEDRDIISGVELTRVGYQKLAAHMNTSVQEVNMMVNELMTKLRNEQHHVAENYESSLNEEDERYAYEKDWLQNVTIRDTETGDSNFLSGAESIELLNALKSHPADEQQILAQYMTHESVTEDEDLDEADDTYDREIEAKEGSYNFPWKVGANHGTGTVVYSGESKIKLVSVRDSDGNEMSFDDVDINDLLRQAMGFIGDA